MKLTFKRVLQLAAIGSVFVGVVATSSMPAGAAVTKSSDVLGTGSDVAFHVMNALDKLYDESPGCEVIAPQGTTQPLDFSCLADQPDTVKTENYAHDQVHEAFGIGGSAGVQQLCQQGQAGVANVDYARQSKAPSTSDCTGTHFVAYARDALTWEAFPGVNGSAVANMHNTAGSCAGSDGFCLTQAQLNGIFVTCSITNWNQVGGANAQISIYTPTPAFGTRKQWDAFLGGDTSHCIPAGQLSTHVGTETDNAQIFANGDAATAISPVSTGSYATKVATHPDGSKEGAVDGIYPTKTTISNGSFPYGRYIYNVYCTASCAAGASSAATVNYVGEKGWICKATTAHGKDPATGANYRKEIATTITKNGFVPLPLGVIGGGVAGSDYCRLFVH